MHRATRLLGIYGVCRGMSHTKTRHGWLVCGGQTWVRMESGVEKRTGQKGVCRKTDRRVGGRKEWARMQAVYLNGGETEQRRRRGHGGKGMMHLGCVGWRQGGEGRSCGLQTEVQRGGVGEGQEGGMRAVAAEWGKIWQRALAGVNGGGETMAAHGEGLNRRRKVCG